MNKTTLFKQALRYCRRRDEQMKTGRLTTPPLGGVWKVTDHGNRPLDFFPSPDGCSCNIFWLYVKRRVLRSLSMEKFLSELKRGWLNV